MGCRVIRHAAQRHSHRTTLIQKILHDTSNAFCIWAGLALKGLPITRPAPIADEGEHLHRIHDILMAQI